MENVVVLAQQMPSWQTVTLTFGSILWVFWSFWWKPHLERKRPFEGLPAAYPTCHWLLGHLPFLAKELDRSYKDLFKEADEQGRIGMWCLSWRCVGLSRWQDIKRVLHAEYHHKIYPLADKHLIKFTGPYNLSMLSDRLWKYERAIILKALMVAARSRRTLSIVGNVTQTLIRSLRARIQQESQDEENQNHSPSILMDVEPLMKMVTLDVFGLVAFSHSFECCEKLRESEVAFSFSFLGAELTRRLTNGPLRPQNYFYSWPLANNRQHAKSQMILRSFLAERIAERHPQEEEGTGDDANKLDQKNDLLASILKAHINDTSEPMQEQIQGIPLDKLLSDLTMSLLFAGYDTTSITLVYLLYEISLHPQIAEECRQEIFTTGVLDNIDNSSTQEMDLTNTLVYCWGVLKETLRLYPPAYTNQRWLEKDVTLPDGYVIEAQTMVLCPVWLAHRTDYNFELPTEFRPDRWVERSAKGWSQRDYETEQKSASISGSIPAGNPDAFFSFSGGARSCPGQAFAWQEALVVMAHLLANFDFALSQDYVLRPDRHGLVQRPKDGMPLKIEIRQF